MLKNELRAIRGKMQELGTFHGNLHSKVDVLVGYIQKLQERRDAEIAAATASPLPPAPAYASDGVYMPSESYPEQATSDAPDSEVASMSIRDIRAMLNGYGVDQRQQVGLEKKDLVALLEKVRKEEYDKEEKAEQEAKKAREARLQPTQVPTSLPTHSPPPSPEGGCLFEKGWEEQTRQREAERQQQIADEEAARKKAERARKAKEQMDALTGTVVLESGGSLFGYVFYSV
jgi:hypothetical protein